MPKAGSFPTSQGEIIEQRGWHILTKFVAGHHERDRRDHDSLRTGRQFCHKAEVSRLCRESANGVELFRTEVFDLCHDRRNNRLRKFQYYQQTG